MPSNTDRKTPPTIEAMIKITSDPINIPIAKLSLKNGTREIMLVTVANTTGVINTALATAIISLDFINSIKPPIRSFGIFNPAKTIILFRNNSYLPT